MHASPLAHLASFAVCAAALLAAAPCASRASTGEAKTPVDHVILHVGLGEEDSYKLGRWCPVRIEFVNFQRELTGRLEVIAPDDEGRPVAYPLSGTFQISPGEFRAVSVEVLIGRPAAELRVRLIEESGRVALERRHALAAGASSPPAEFVALSIGPEMGLAEAAESRQQDSAIRTLHAAQPARLPTSWWGYEGIDLVVLSTSDPALWERLDDEQLAALTAWVGQGGRLLVTIGTRGQAMLGPGGPLAELSPVEYLGQTQVREMQQLELFSGSHAPLMGRDEPGGPAVLDIPLVEPRGAEVLLRQSLRSGETPLVVRGPYGLGEVTLVLCDLDQPPLATWPALPIIMSRLNFERLRDTRSSEATESRRAAHLGYDSLQGQLREALEQFPQVRFVPFWLVALLAVGYILLIGPVDYFLLRWYGRRMGATWITFPLMAAGLALAVVLVGGAAKSSRPAINQVEVVDIDLVDGYLRGNEWAYLYSPANRRYNIAAQLEHQDFALSASSIDNTEVRLGWQGRSGVGFGGMSATGPLASAAGSGYSILAQGESAEIESMPLTSASTRALGARWGGRFDPPASPELRLGSQGSLAGSVRNPLAVELREAWLFHAEWAWHLGTLPPGAVRSFDSATKAENLNWRLTRRTIRELRDVTTPWDQTTTEIPRILEVMLFHQAAGGKTYTRLSDDSTRGLDMSELLGYERNRHDRAVLWGLAPAPALQLSLDGETPPAGANNVDRQGWSLYRLVLPVTVPERQNQPE